MQTAVEPLQTHNDSVKPDPAVATTTVCCMQTAVKLMEARVDSMKAAVSTSQQTAQTHAITPPAASTSTAAELSTAAPQASAHPDRLAAGKGSSSSVVGTSASAAASRSAAAGQPGSADQAPEVGVSTANKAQDAATPSTSASAAPTAVTTTTNAALPQLPMSAALSVDRGADPTGPTGQGSASLQAEAARKEMADLESVLEDMYEKVEELQQIVKEQISTKNALKVSAVSVVFSVMHWYRVTCICLLCRC